MSFTSLGIDPSTAATGLVLLEANGSDKPKLLIEREIKEPKRIGIDRRKAIVTEIMMTIHEMKPNRIVVEGYSLNMKNASSVIPLVELGGLLRFMLHIDGLQWFDPRATEVKKFVSGKGNTKKTLIPMFVLKRWGHASQSDDTADAYVCAAMGLAQANRLGNVTLEMRQIAGALKAVGN